jgi:hypothetical protein
MVCFAWFQRNHSFAKIGIDPGVTCLPAFQRNQERYSLRNGLLTLLSKKPQLSLKVKIRIEEKYGPLCCLFLKVRTAIDGDQRDGNGLFDLKKVGSFEKCFKI